MNTLEKKKLNILLHLAKVDGKFHSSERALLAEFIREKGALENSADVPLVPPPGSAKSELLFWALRLVQADGVIHDREIAYCRDLATKLNFSDGVVEHFLARDVPAYDVFCEELERYT